MLNYWDEFQLWNIRTHDWSNWKKGSIILFSLKFFCYKSSSTKAFRTTQNSTSGMWKKVHGDWPCSQFRTGHQFGKAKVGFLSFPNHVLLRASFLTEIFTEKLSSNSLCLDLKKSWFLWQPNNNILVQNQEAAQYSQQASWLQCF